MGVGEGAGSDQFSDDEGRGGKTGGTPTPLVNVVV